MNKLHILGGALLFAVLGTGFAYIVGTGFLSFWRGYNGQYLDWLAIVREYPSLRSTDPRAFQILNLIWAGFVLLSLVLAANVLTEKLPTFGTAHWQSRRELKKNGFLGKPGRGFVVGKTGSPEGRGRFLCSAAFPHCLLVAPTGAGKGISFVIPNLLLFQGSAVVLDVKGENFELTSRHRQSMGDKIWRFAPLDWENPGHRYNPLDRINALPNPDQRQMEIRLLAELFLEAEDDGTKGLLEGGIDLFVACGIYAIERGTPTLGEIYRLASAGGDKQKQYMKYADDVQSSAARLIFERLASTNDRTLTSYLSLLMTSGLSLWSNPAIDRATETSDFSFRDFRRFPQSAYFIAPPHNKMTAIAPLVRLFFSDLLSSLHDRLPGEDEPWRVMIMLDEFDMLGRMPSVTDSIKTLRAYGGHLAVVTQTIPALDKIYGEDTRLSLQGGAGVKIYLAPAEQRTKAELSAAVGKTTVRVTSKSRTIGKGPFNGINISERHEERDLLTEDEAGRLKKDDLIILANGHHPIKAWRISYFDDKVLKPIFEAQKGPLPGPDSKDKELRSMRGELMLATNKITELAQKVDAVAANRSRVKAALPRVVLEQIGKTSSDAQSPAKSPASDAASPKADSAAPLVLRRQRDLSPLVGSGLAISTTDAAVRVMVEATEKVRRISSGDDGYALEAG